MRGATAILVVILAACSDGGGGAIDGPPGHLDGPPGQADAPPGWADAAPGLTCAYFCDLVMGHCSGENLQFENRDDCMASCATWPPGDMADTLGNTLGCRIYHAGYPASQEPSIHCRHAGPSGDNVCGVPCVGFCTLVQGVCTGGNQVYADSATCRSSCNGFATDPPYSANVTSGNSYACRLYHATKASTTPATHCAHTAVASSQCQ